MSTTFDQVVNFAREIRKGKLEGKYWIYVDKKFVVHMVNKLPNQYWIKGDILVVDDVNTYLKEVNKRDPTKTELASFVFIHDKPVEISKELQPQKEELPKITLEQMNDKERNYIIKYFEMSGFEKNGDVWYFNPKFVFKKIERIKSKDFLDIVQNKKIPKEILINDEDVFMNLNTVGLDDMNVFNENVKFERKCFDMIRKMYPKPLFYWTNKSNTEGGMAITLKDLIDLYGKSFDDDFKVEMAKYLNGKKSKQKETVDQILLRLKQ